MRYLLLLALSATPALAHEGAHHHPHGVEGVWVIFAVALAAGALGWWLARGRR